MTNIWGVVDELIKRKEKNIAEINAMIEDDFNPSDWSGGNFDDAYQIGCEHGYEYGYIDALQRIKSVMENGH